jgi:TonB family protein
MPAEHQKNMASSAQIAPFSLLPESRPPWKEFLFSSVTQGGAVAVLLWIGVLHPQVLAPPVRDYHAVELVTTPPPVNHEPAPVKQFKVPETVARIQLPPPAVLHTPAPIPKIHETETPVAPKVEIAESKPNLPTVKPAIPRKLVQTNVFSTGSSAIPTMAAAPQKVQTGGFGDPNGLPAKDSQTQPVNIAKVGSFDLPAGPGSGNGTGGAKGAKGVVASTGFGSGVATGDGSGKVNASRGNGVVQPAAAFGDASAKPDPATRPKTAEVEAKTVPAQILSKPTPAYTAEARQLKVEGEVLLEVVLEASGKVRVVRVVRGLGHGLDESAMRAAQQISFRPALRDGQPADSTAVLHIIFQLA